nr:transposase, MuDR, MULE transposase domain protein [Tanacetum cinerariifolium]
MMLVDHTGWKLRCRQWTGTTEQLIEELESTYELDGEAGFADVAENGVDSSGLNHDESFGVDDLDLNLNEHVNLNVSQVETQSELHVSEKPDVGPTQEPILAEVSTQEPIMAEVSTQEPIVVEVSTDAPIVEEVGNQEFSVKDVVIEDYILHMKLNMMKSSEDAGTDDDDDVDEDFFIDEENEIVEPDVDVHLFGISMDLPFNNIGITNLVSDDVLEGEDVDVINADDFDNDVDSDPGNDEERNYRKRRLAELRTEMEGVINASGQWKRNLKLYKNDSVRIAQDVKEKCMYLQCHKILEQVRVNLDIPVKAVQDQLQRELEVQISMSKAFRAKAKTEREIREDHVLHYS